ncbi:MAG: zinc ribbon domain-containing protein [Gammaproteobacteria bacterium]|nr:zinc ribbon domain-containing protein [Gammaproteobacteria bacterium]
MPIYEYSCNACDNKLEVLQKISEEPLVYCPECGAPELKKLVSAAAFRLKGTGWYETDFKDKAKEEKPAVNKSDDKADKKSATADSKTKSEGSTDKGAKSSDTAKSTDTKSKSSAAD